MRKTRKALASFIAFLYLLSAGGFLSSIWISGALSVKISSTATEVLLIALLSSVALAFSFLFDE